MTLLDFRNRGKCNRDWAFAAPPHSVLERLSAAWYKIRAFGIDAHGGRRRSLSLEPFTRRVQTHCSSEAPVAYSVTWRS